MKSMLAIIDLENEHHYFHELANSRNGAIIPFASQYRIIDFTLSNIVRSKMKEVAIFTREKYGSLMDCLGDGADFGLNLRNGGLSIFVPDWNQPADISRGNLQFYHNHRHFFTESDAEYVLITGSQFVANIDYDEVLNEHISSGADLTLITTRLDGVAPECKERFRIVDDEQNWVKEINLQKENEQVFAGAFIINKQVLLQLIDQCVDHFGDNLFIDGILKNLNELKVKNYEFKQIGLFINSIESYYRHQMNLISDEHLQTLIYSDHQIQTKSTEELPTVYGDGADINQSMLADGCKINGEVSESILFAGVHVKRGAKLKNCIILKNCTIGEDVYLENVILDENMTIEHDETYIGAKEYPFVISQSKVI